MIKLTTTCKDLRGSATRDGRFGERIGTNYDDPIEGGAGRLCHRREAEDKLHCPRGIGKN